MFKRQTLIALLVIITVIGSISFGMVMYSENKSYKNYLKAQYQMNLYNLLGDVKDMQVSLSKATVAQSPSQRAKIFEEISRGANGAKDRLHSLPIAHESIAQTSKFLSQVSNYTYTLVKDNKKGHDASDEVIKTVEELKSYTSYLTLQLQALEREIISGNFNWEQIRNQVDNKIDTNIKDSLDIKFNSISNEMQEYPTLIYDGPYSDNALNIKPKILNQKVVSQSKALECAREVIGDKVVDKIKVIGEVKSDTIPAYTVTASLKGQKDPTISMDISKNGGKLIYMLNNRQVTGEKLSMKDAITKGNDYIKKNGYPQMIPLFALKYDNVAVINFVYVKDKTVIYADQVKLKVALDNGEVIGVEAHTYLKNHSEDRTIDNPKIDYKKLSKTISEKAKVKNVRLALIPMDETKEVLCYEYVAEKNGEKYIVYFNATTGEEENILKIIETPNGELTM
ncbi:MAG: germination protein YpeB [Clostridium sp.]